MVYKKQNEKYSWQCLIPRFNEKDVFLLTVSVVTLIFLSPEFGLMVFRSISSQASYGRQDNITIAFLLCIPGMFLSFVHVWFKLSKSKIEKSLMIYSAVFISFYAGLSYAASDSEPSRMGAIFAFWNIAIA